MPPPAQVLVGERMVIRKEGRLEIDLPDSFVQYITGKVIEVLETNEELKRKLAKAFLKALFRELRSHNGAKFNVNVDLTTLLLRSGTILTRSDIMVLRTILAKAKRELKLSAKQAEELERLEKKLDELWRF